MPRKRTQSSRPNLEGLLACRVPPEIITRIDRLVARAEYPTTRSDIVRRLIYQALKAQRTRASGVRAAG
jgi:Arc/MetJ-type ribon-helix-helix transcriptional regulator